MQGARERILEAAYELFAHQGINAVGIDRIIAEADVAKATLYHHFASKEALVIAFLDLREQRWTRGWLQAEVERRAADPKQRLLAVFDALDEWFRRPDFEGCPFINALLEIGDLESPVHAETVRQLAIIRGLLEGYAQEAGLREPRMVADQVQILMMGSIVSAGCANREAAVRVRPLVDSLLAGPPRAGDG